MKTLPLKRTSLSDAAYETLLEAILRGQIAPGEELSAVALAERFQVSRTPITDALQRLAHDGLVEQPANRQPRVVKLDRNDVVEIYAMRGLLEAAAAERAAMRIAPETVKALRAVAIRLAKMRKTPSWNAQAIDFDLAFHDAIAEAADNERLRADIARYRRLVRCFCRLTGSDVNLQAALGEHRTILTALAARKPIAARKAMAAHIELRLAAVLAELYPEK
ncbi:MAG: GntR family transcriptional regulator [Planctomycetia bacterium]|nr:GntR family transcriptional regulator [Planctomycetia bacterium]